MAATGTLVQGELVMLTTGEQTAVLSAAQAKALVREKMREAAATLAGGLLGPDADSVTGASWEGGQDQRGLFPYVLVAVPIGETINAGGAEILAQDAKDLVLDFFGRVRAGRNVPDPPRIG